MAILQVKLPRAQHRRVKKLCKKTNSKLTATRCRIIMLLHDGNTVKEVTEKVGCVRATVYRTVYRFEDYSELGLQDLRQHRSPTKVSPEVNDYLLAYVEKCPKDYGWNRSNWTLELFSLQLKKDCGVKLSPSYIGKLLKLIGCSRTRPCPVLRIPIKGRGKIIAKIKRLIKKSSNEEPVFYQDEADIHLNPKLGATYTKKGQQLKVVTPGKNVKRYAFGALHVKDGSVLYTIEDRKNSEGFIDFLNKLAKKYSHCRRIHLVLDNYIIHKSRKVKAYLDALDGRIKLHFLPPYSPNENKIEGLWKQLHDNVTRNHKHKEINSLLNDVKRFMKKCQPYPGTKVSLLRAA